MMTMIHALRSLRRTPVFAAAAATTLALGIGALASAFAIAYGVLLEPLPYGHPERLVNVGMSSTELRRMQMPPALFNAYRQARSLEAVGFYRVGNANLSDTTGVMDAERVTATWATASTIPLLQVRPLLGRAIREDEDRGGGPNVAVISEALWRTYFHADPDVIGKKVLVNNVPRAIVGVMPRSFVFPSSDTKLWLPARLDRDSTGWTDIAYWSVARLSPGATPANAARELGSFVAGLGDSAPTAASGTTAWFERGRLTPVVVPLREELTHDIARTLWMLAAAAGLVLFVAMANVANLILIRADARQLDLAVREALGASRWRIATYFLGESVALSMIAGASALVMAWFAIRGVVAFGPADVPRLMELHLDLATVALVAVISAGVALFGAIVPTIRIRSGPLSVALRDGGRGETAGRRRQRIRSALAGFQLALALSVLAGSVLLLRTFQRFNAQRPGFDAANVMTVWTQLSFARYNDSASVRFFERLTESVAALPGVVSVGLTDHLPLADGETRQLSFRGPDGALRALPVVSIGGRYFSAMSIPLLAGRDFQRVGEQRGGEIVLSERAARIFFGDAPSAVGRTIALAPSGPTYTVLGVVGDVRDHDLGAAPSPVIYMPEAVPLSRAEPQVRHSMALVVKTKGAPTAIVAPIRRIVHDLDSTVPIFNISPMRDVVAGSTARLSFLLAVMSAAAVVTLVLGAIGLYGVLAYMVALRTRELGIRIALGANPKQVAQSVVLRALPAVAGGTVGGLVLYALAAPLLRAFLFGVTAADPLTLIGATSALLATSAIATVFPARRAARIDPAVALRSE